MEYTISSRAVKTAFCVIHVMDVACTIYFRTPFLVILNTCIPISHSSPPIASTITTKSFSLDFSKGNRVFHYPPHYSILKVSSFVGIFSSERANTIANRRLLDCFLM